MEVDSTEIPDIKILRPKVFSDARGFFLESWNRRTFKSAGIDVDFVQDNHSRSLKGTLRGLHYQVQHTQGKLIRVISGRVFDVAVDIRRSSPTFGQWIGMILSNEIHQILWIPPGFAHGFLALSDTADVVYKCTDVYSLEHERTIRWDDPDLAIDWPLPADDPPQLSAKDAIGGAFRDADYLP